MAAVAAREIDAVESRPSPESPVAPGATARPAGRGAAEPKSLRWSREEYYRLGRLRLFDGHGHVELIDGEIVEMSPQESAHATAGITTADVFRRVFPAGYHV